MQDPSILDLRDLAQPAPVSLAPQTWGWYVLFAAAIGLVALTVWLAVRHHLANRYRRAALAELRGLNEASTIALLVKRVCLTAFPRVEVASLSGDDYLRFLDSTIDGSPFTTGPGRALGDHYGGENGDVSALASTVGTWIRKHRARA